MHENPVPLGKDVRRLSTYPEDGFVVVFFDCRFDFYDTSRMKIKPLAYGLR